MGKKKADGAKARKGHLFIGLPRRTHFLYLIWHVSKAFFPMKRGPRRSAPPIPLVPSSDLSPYSTASGIESNKLPPVSSSSFSVAWEGHFHPTSSRQDEERERERERGEGEGTNALSFHATRGGRRLELSFFAPASSSSFSGGRSQKDPLNLLLEGKKKPARSLRPLPEFHTDDLNARDEGVVRGSGGGDWCW